MLRIDILTLFPSMFEGVLGASILKRAAEPVPDPADPSVVRDPVVSYRLWDIRDYTTDKHHKVDASPYGGGPGMVMQCPPVWAAVAAAEQAEPGVRPRRVLLTPQGRPLTQPLAQELSSEPRLLLIAGHYEGIDERVIDRLRDTGGLDEISVGDYVLSGGELPAMVLIDAVVRLLPGALGHAASAHHDSFSPGAEGLLDHPHYTRPPQWDGRAVPPVLMSGDHGKIDAWRRERSIERTRARRPDLLGLDAGPDRSAGAAAAPPTRPSPCVIIRPEQPGDAPTIRAIYRAAFNPYEGEAEMLDAVEAEGEIVFSDVATVRQGGRERVIGHAAWSGVYLSDQPGVVGMLCLGPIAVEPGWQRRGVGAALVERGVAQCRETNAKVLFLLGDPGYYGRFGFRPAGPLGWGDIYDAGDAWMALPLVHPVPEHLLGVVRPRARAFLPESLERFKQLASRP